MWPQCHEKIPLGHLVAWCQQSPPLRCWRFQPANAAWEPHKGYGLQYPGLCCRRKPLIAPMEEKADHQASSVSTTIITDFCPWSDWKKWRLRGNIGLNWLRDRCTIYRGKEIGVYRNRTNHDLLLSLTKSGLAGYTSQSAGPHAIYAYMPC